MLHVEIQFLKALKKFILYYRVNLFCNMWYDISVKHRAFTFYKMSHFSKNVNHVLFEMSYLFNQLLDYKKITSMERRRKRLSICINLFFRISINVNILTLIALNIFKNSDIFNVEVNICIEVTVYLKSKTTNQEL